jgi:general secretion pathway protein D
MSRTLASLLVLALIVQLGACAEPGLTPSEDPSAVLLNPEPAASAVAAPEPPASAADDDNASTQPLIIRGNDSVVAARRVPADVPARGASTRLQFENAPVGEVVNVMLRDLLKVDYVVHPPLSGTVTLTTRQTVKPDRALLLLETALQANGIVMARDSGGTYHVGTPENLRGIISAPVLAEPGKRLPPGYGAVIIPLEYLGAAEMANLMRPMIAPDAILRVDTVRNILVMRGTRAEAEGWMELVNTFDVNLLRGMSVGIFPLKHTTAADVEAALRMLSGGAMSGSAAGAIAGGGGGAAAARPPVPPQGQQRAGAPAGPVGAPSAPIGLSETSPLFGAVRVLPIERINAVMVATPRAAYLDEIRYWIEQFDRPNLNSAQAQLFVYKVRNSSADHLAELLNGIYGGTTGGPAGTGATGVAPGLNTATGTTGPFGSNAAFGNNRVGGTFGNSGFGNNTGFGNSGFGNNGFGSGGFGGMGMNNRLGGNTQQGAQQTGGNVGTVMLSPTVRVMADRINNTLLIHAMPAEYERIEATLKRLDIQRAQVLIEASIIEVTLGDDLQYGLQWAFNGGIGGGRSGVGSLNGAIDGSLASAFSYSVLNSAGAVTAVLSTLANKSLIRVISSPSLMVLDNHTASIQVGDQEPINTGTTITGTGTTTVNANNIQYKDTGVTLGVTPSVNAGDLITLDIDQTISNVVPNSGLEGAPRFMQRQITSQVAVRSGETMVLGGLIQDNTSRGSSGVPILSSIPIIGALFGTKNNTAKRTELLVILSPRVVRSDEDARAVSRELRERMRGLTASDMLANPPPPQRVTEN